MYGLRFLPALWLTAAAGAVAAAAAAQIDPGHIVVLTRAPGLQAPATLLDIDPSTGTFARLPRFPQDQGRPLAVGVDPIDGGVIVAVENAPGASTLLRLHFAGGGPVRTRTIGGLNGTITAVGFDVAGDVLVLHDDGAGGGGITRFPRGGGAPAMVVALAGPAAMGLLPRAAYAVVVESTSAGYRLSMVDLSTGQIVVGPAAIPGLSGRRITGVHDLPTGAFRQALSDDLGAVHLFENLTVLSSVPMSPPLPAGATVRSHGDGLDLLAVGSARHPHLVAIPVFGAGAGRWSPLAGPLPGDPVDFASLPPAGPRVVPFGASCGAGGSTGWAGEPRLGDARFAVAVQGAGLSAPALLVLGASDQWSGAVALPFALPGGCPLRVSAEATVPTRTGGSGFATVPLPVPNAAALAGVRLFAQWVVAPGGSLGSSDGLAIWIGG